MADTENRFLDELPVGLWVGLAPDGQVVYTNAAFREIMAMPPVTESRIGDAPSTYGVSIATAVPTGRQAAVFSGPGDRTAGGGG